MRIVNQSFTIEYAPDPEWLMLHLERCARTCYKSEGKIAPGSADRLIRAIIDRGHESVLEHAVITVRIVCDRGVSHELVRHRLAAYSQESTRYCRYADGIDVIIPSYLTHDSAQYSAWWLAMSSAERAYTNMLSMGVPPEIARSVLPNATKTELVMTANLREWRHVFSVRCVARAHPQMRELMEDIRDAFVAKYPVIFGVIKRGKNSNRAS